MLDLRVSLKAFASREEYDAPRIASRVYSVTGLLEHEITVDQPTTLVPDPSRLVSPW